MSQQTFSIEQVRELTKRKPRGMKSAKHRARFAATPPAPVHSESERQAQRSLFERHDAAVWTIRFPLSPSANGLKSIRAIPDRRPFLVPSTEYNAYKDAVARAWREHWHGWPPEPLQGRLRVLIVVHQARNGGDIANREKAICDALSECGAWIDDQQIDDLRMIRGAVVKGTGALDVTIETISEN